MARLTRMAMRADLVAKWLLDSCLRSSSAFPDVAALRSRRSALCTWQAALMRNVRKDRGNGTPSLTIPTIVPGRLAIVGEPMIAASSEPLNRDLISAFRSSTCGADVADVSGAPPWITDAIAVPLSASTLISELMVIANRIGVAPALAAALIKCSTPSVANLSSKASEAAVASDKGGAKPSSAGKASKTSMPPPSASSAVPSVDALALGVGGSLAFSTDLVFACLLLAQWQLAGVTASVPVPSPSVAAPATNTRSSSSAASTSAVASLGPISAASDITNRIFVVRRALAASVDVFKTSALSDDSLQALLKLSTNACCWGFNSDAHVTSALALFPPDGSDIGAYI